MLKYTCARTDEKAAYLILGIENQDTVSYAMPARTMLYDAEQYVGQMRGIEKLHRDKAPGAGAEKETPRHDRQRGAALISSGEFLEGFQKDDRLIPVFTVVINWSGKAWTGFRTLHEMFGPVDSSVLAFIPDYRINLISPTEMSEEELMLFSTSLRQVFSFIRHSGDKDSLIRVTNEDTGFRSMDRESVEIINMVTGANIRIRKREETINVCKAIDDLVKEKDTAVKEKFILLRERDEILRENDDIRRENDDIRRKNDDIRRERDDARRENDDIRKERDDARRNSLIEQCSILRNIMHKLSVSASEAMNIAGIPEEKRPLLAAELTKTAKA